MSRCLLLGAASLFIVSFAKQPSAPVASPAVLRDLPWGDVNFLHTTDSHGWHGGHLQEPQYNADWGDYISFAGHLRSLANQNGRDLLLIDTGDRLEGNGLYDGSKPPGQYTYDIFKSAPIDIMTVGNHELYINTTAAREFTTMVPLYKSSYLASNLNITDPPLGAPVGAPTVPFAPRFKKFKTSNQNRTVLAFGFLYNFGKPADNLRIQNVSDTVKEKWFLDALNSGPIDLIVVAGHVQLATSRWAGQEFPWIFDAIRKNAATRNTPIAFFGGHAHVRDARKFDDRAYGIASGRYAETVGFLSLSNLSNNAVAGEDNDISSLATPNLTCQRRYIDSNLFSYYHHSGKTSATFDTQLGIDVSKDITKARAALQLDKAYGCAPSDLSLYYAPYLSNQSILTWLETQVFPDTWAPLLTPPAGGRGTDCSSTNGTGNPLLVMTNSGAIGFDIFKGPFTVDSVINMSPFVSGFKCLTAVPAALARQMVAKLNAGPPMIDDEAEDGEAARARLWEELRISPSFLSDQAASLEPEKSGYAIASDGSHVDQTLMWERTMDEPALQLGYVTTDELGTDGDDTPHIPYPTYTVANVIDATIALPTATPIVVDVVYNEFMEKAVLAGLKDLGASHTSADTRSALGGKSLTAVVADWVRQKWPCSKQQSDEWKNDL